MILYHERELVMFTMTYTLSEPTVAVSGTSIKSSGILKDLILNLTA